MGEIEIRRLVEPEAFIPRPKAVAHRGRVEALFMARSDPACAGALKMV